MEKMNINDIFPMAPSSIYATIKALVKKGYISGRRVQESNFPAKTIYQATPAGQAALKEAVAGHLEAVENYYTEFDVSLSLICHLSRAEALAALARHGQEVHRQLRDRRDRYEELKRQGVIPYTGLIRRLHNILKLEADLSLMAELRENIEKDEAWNHFPAVDVEI